MKADGDKVQEALIELSKRDKELYGLPEIVEVDEHASEQRPENGILKIDDEVKNEKDDTDDMQKDDTGNEQADESIEQRVKKTFKGLSDELK